MEAPVEPPTAPRLGPEETLTQRERVSWALLGLGCTWYMNDAVFLQLPFWVASQPEGLKLGARIALAGSLTPLPAVAAVLCQRLYPRQMQKFAIPAMISLSLAAGLCLAAGLWRMSSWFIYLPMFMASTVGGLTPYVQLPWILGQGFKPAVISPLFLGGSVGSLSMSLVAIAQSPGSARRISPSLFFALATLPLLGSLLAYSRVVSRRIGASTAGVRKSALLPPARTGGSSCAESALTPVADGATSLLPLELESGWQEWRVWVPQVLPLVLWMSVISTCTWTVSRSSMGFATTHTVPGHHLCRPECAAFCSSLMDHARPDNKSACAAEPVCTVMSADVMGGRSDDGAGREATALLWQCAENRGEYWLGWMTSLAQWAYTLVSRK